MMIKNAIAAHEDTKAFDVFFLLYVMVVYRIASFIYNVFICPIANDFNFQRHITDAQTNNNQVILGEML